MSGVPAGIRLTTFTLSAPDAVALARFYRDLLGWELGDAEPGWATLHDPAGGRSLGFHADEHWQPPVWPSRPGAQSMQAHLEVHCDDLDAAVAHAGSLGARLAEFQPQDDVRVMLDPVGHPFCLYL